MGSYRRNNYYATINIEIYASTTFIENLRDEYMFLIRKLKEVDEDVLIKGVSPGKKDSPILDPDNLPHKVAGMNKHFFSTSKAPKVDQNGEKGMIWATALIDTDDYFDDITSTNNYNLETEGIVLMKKRLRCFRSVTPAYFQFLDNRADLEDIK